MVGPQPPGWSLGALGPVGVADGFGVKKFSRCAAPQLLPSFICWMWATYPCLDFDYWQIASLRTNTVMIVSCSRHLFEMQ